MVAFERGDSVALVDISALKLKFTAIMKGVFSYE